MRYDHEIASCSIRFIHLCLYSRRLASSTVDAYPIHITIDAKELKPAIMISH